MGDSRSVTLGGDRVACALDTQAPGIPMTGEAEGVVSFPLMRLAGELRNKVYKEVLRSSPPLLYTGPSGAPTIRGVLSAVSQQVRSEFNPLCAGASVIATTVTNFDFTHVARFIDGLTDAEFGEFAPPKAGIEDGGHRILVELVLTEDCDPVPRGLVTWLWRYQRPMGSTIRNVRIQYIARGTAKLNEEFVRFLFPGMPPFCLFGGRNCHHCPSARLPETPRYREKGRIRDAMLQACAQGAAVGLVADSVAS